MGFRGGQSTHGAAAGITDSAYKPVANGYGKHSRRAGAIGWGRANISHSPDRLWGACLRHKNLQQRTRRKTPSWRGGVAEELLLQSRRDYLRASGFA